MSLEEFKEWIRTYIKWIVNGEKYHLGNWVLKVTFRKFPIKKTETGVEASWGKCKPYMREITINTHFYDLIQNPDFPSKDVLWDTILHEIAHLSKTPRQYNFYARTGISNKKLSSYATVTINKDHNIYFWAYLEKLHKKYDNLKIPFLKGVQQ